MKKKLIAPLIYYFLAIAGFTTSLLCQENNKLFSFSMALMFTMSGSLIGELVSKRVQVPKPTLQKLGKWLLAAILCSVLCYIFMTGITSETYSSWPLTLFCGYVQFSIFYIRLSVSEKEVLTNR